MTFIGNSCLALPLADNKQWLTGLKFSVQDSGILTTGKNPSYLSFHSGDQSVWSGVLPVLRWLDRGDTWDRCTIAADNP